jgi:site-specific recombinase XerD
MNTELAKVLKDFFQSYLQDQKRVSPHTLKSYRDTFKLFLAYLNGQHPSRPPTIEDLNVKTILDFLKHLEDPQGRGNSALTRNQRLAAIQGFFHYLPLHHPSLEPQAKRILAIPLKRIPQKVVQSLNRQELGALLAQPQTTRSDGIRDLVILLVLYNAGARASEVADLKRASFDFPNRTVTIFGKGSKERITPLWPPTVRLLQLYAKRHRRIARPGFTDYFFINQRGCSFSRFGIRAIVKRHLRAAAKCCPSLAAKRLSTHSLRHTCAVHLLESRVDPNVIKAWLGHASISSTSRYLDTDLAHKRRILEQFGPPPYVKGLENPPNEATSKDLWDWLNDL